MDESNIIPLQALLEETGGDPSVLNAADVIIAHDLKSDHTAVIYGPELLYGFDTSGASEDVNIMRVGIDFESDELDPFLSLVESVKGKHDYESE